MKYSPLDNHHYHHSDILRRVKRILDGNISYRKLFIALVIFTILFLYSGPKIFRYIFGSSSAQGTHIDPAPVSHCTAFIASLQPLFTISDPLSRCMDERLTPFYHPALEFDVNIRHQPPFPHELDAIPFVGNGYFGVEISRDASIHIKGRRGLQTSVPFHPLVSVKDSDLNDALVLGQESTVAEYQSGVVHRFQCNGGNRFYASYQYYAHRNMPSVLVQEIKITNLRQQVIDIELLLPRVADWQTAVAHKIKLQHGSTIQEYWAVTGSVEMPGTDKVRVVAVVYRDTGRTLTLTKRGTTGLQLLTTIKYSEAVSKVDFQTGELRTQTEKQAIAAMEKALQEAVHEERARYYEFRRQHVRVWTSLWATGFGISTSRAEGALNGDRINSTIYAVLSQVPAYEFEDSVTPQRTEEIRQALIYAEGCYDSYHTLEAEDLWRGMDTMAAMNEVVSSWLLTLEKNGCHNLIRAGASGVVQAMVLSMGSFRFSNQHLEWRIHPKYLHREYRFRRLNYGDMTHVNVSVEVTEENRAVIYAALDRSDGHYYACDGGCLDDPVQLLDNKRMFPVKLTEPLTAILYITEDREHMQELKHAIHVKEVAEGESKWGEIIEIGCFLNNCSFC